MKYSVAGLDRLIAKTDPAVLRKPLKDFFNRVAIAVENRAKQKAAVDAGQLRADVQHEIDSADMPRFAKVGILEAHEGSQMWYKARAMEFGTARQGDPAISHKASHFPPWGERNPSLELWATRHGFESGFMVALAIFRKGGVKAHPFLRPALNESVGDIKKFLNQLGDDLKAMWEKR